MTFESVLTEWAKIAGPVFNAVYEENGPKKWDIEAMVTDIEYEARIAELILEAWDGWGGAGTIFNSSSLRLMEKILIVQATFNHPQTEYGWYRGSLYSLMAIKRALEAI